MSEPLKFADLSPTRALLKLSGGDRERYLNGQTTNDVRKACKNEGLFSLVTTAKGKLEAEIFLSTTPDEDAFLIDTPIELREPLLSRLDKYIIADDAEVEDVSEDWQLVHAIGSIANVPEVWQRKVNRYGVEGVDLLAPAETTGSLREALLLKDPAAVEFNQAELLTMRVRHGFGAWGSELTADILPQEANLQDRAVDFHKGCYIGQEVISRIKSAGRVNKQLVALVSDSAEVEISAGTELVAATDAAVVGNVTSAVVCPELGQIIALALVKRGYNEPGTILQAKTDENILASSFEIRETPLS